MTQDVDHTIWTIMSHIDAPDPDPTALEDWSRPLARLRVEAVCLGRALMPDSKTIERTVATIVLFGVWATLVLAPLFDVASTPRYEILITTTAIVFTILGRMWDFEVQRALNSIRLSDGGQTQHQQRSRCEEDE